MATKTTVPAVEGWFNLATPSTDGGQEQPPALLGSRCTTCGTFAFPKETFFCRNPECDSTAFDEVPLSRRGTIWSYTDARYQPPPPYVPADPYEPFAIVAVELADEKMVVMGQVVAGVDVADLRIGMDVELVVDTLYEDDENEYVVWKWAPVNA
ncbi:MAG TPA: OB-fold domain-containing protein [Acidimicrobiales bacterium]|nr:OB-fold domain-containing protein [Acidimicrobiales bacterium]